MKEGNRFPLFLITPNGEFVMSLSPAKQKFVDVAAAKYGEGAVLTKQEVVDVRNENGLGWPSWFVRAPYKVGRG